MEINQDASNLIDITVKAFNGDVSSVSPTDGIALINSWVSFLQSDSQGNDALVADLNELKATLQQGNLDGAHIQDVINSLTSQTKQIADAADEDSQPRLGILAEGLQDFSQQFTSPSQRDNSGKQAPMTSTVGGDSTTSGAGVSALGTSDDDLSNRNGGTTSSGPTADIDDTTGRDSGATKAHSSEETGDFGGSSTGNGDNSVTTQRSRSDTARVDGMGVSGGSGDSDYSQSGGRSQY